MATRASQNNILAKVIIVGDSGVGKTNLLTKFCDGVFKDTYVATIGVDFKIKTVHIDDTKVKLQIWDTAGQERFRNITQTYYKGASGVILAYSISNKQSFKNIGGWIKQIQSNASENTNKILIALKSDMQDSREVEEEEGKALAAKYNMSFLEVSAKAGRNVEQAFMSLARQIMDSRAAFPTDYETLSLRGKSTIQQQKENCKC